MAGSETGPFRRTSPGDFRARAPRSTADCATTSIAAPPAGMLARSLRPTRWTSGQSPPGAANVIMQLSWPEVGHGVVGSKVDSGNLQASTTRHRDESQVVVPVVAFLARRRAGTSCAGDRAVVRFRTINQSSLCMCFMDRSRRVGATSFLARWWLSCVVS